MNPLLAVAAIVVTAGAVVGVAARDGRIALAGLAGVLVVSPFLADPLPPLLALLVRVVAALLAVYLAWIAVRSPGSVTRGSLLGWPVEALIAAAAWLIGFGTAGLGAPPLGLPEAQAAGFALVALAVGPIVSGRDVYRLGSGAVLLVSGVLLIRAALAGTPSQLEELVSAALFIGLGGVVAFLVTEAAEAGAAGGAVLDELPDPATVHASRVATGGR
ncbi:MAG TPA: hypothetical protein VF323_03480 [Candidatus Limnocylindrales bacterium]